METKFLKEEMAIYLTWQYIIIYKSFQVLRSMKKCADWANRNMTNITEKSHPFGLSGYKLLILMNC